MKISAILAGFVALFAYYKGVNGIIKPGISREKIKMPKNHILQAKSNNDNEFVQSGASISTSTFNLAKSIIGAGVLSLPNGIALFSDRSRSLVPASLITVTLGIISAYSFSLIGSACDATKSSSFKEAWSKSIDSKTAWIISAVIAAKGFFGALAYSLIIADSFSSLAQSFSLPAALTQRSNVLLGITSLVLLPMCSLRSLASLAPFSLLGLGGTVYTAIFMAIRYLDGSYLPAGQLLSTIPATLQPSFNQRIDNSIFPKVFVLIAMLSTSFMSHYNAPKFFAELKDNSISRFNQVTTYAYSVSIATYVFMMSVGFLTFGGASAGLVLNNYSKYDILAKFARLAVGLSILTGFPFAFTAMRDGVLDLANISQPKRAELFQVITFGFLAVITLLGLVLKDVGVVVSLSGALFGSLLMFIFPALMDISIIKSGLVKHSSLTIFADYVLIGIGLITGVLGASISVLKSFGRL